MGTVLFGPAIALEAGKNLLLFYRLSLVCFQLVAHTHTHTHTHTHRFDLLVFIENISICRIDY